MLKLFQQALTAALVACVLLAQWLALLTGPVVPVTSLSPQPMGGGCVHAPCCCPAGMVASKACCCAMHGGAPAGVIEKLIQSSNCDGKRTVEDIAISKLDWAVDQVDHSIHLAGSERVIVVPANLFSVRNLQPPVPPPKSLLCFV